MANWTGTTMIGSSNVMLETVGKMEELNKELMKSVYVYSQAMQDNVKEGTEEMINRIDALLASIRKRSIERKLFSAIFIYNTLKIDAILIIIHNPVESKQANNNNLSLSPVTFKKIREKEKDLHKKKNSDTGKKIS